MYSKQSSLSHPASSHRHIEAERPAPGRQTLTAGLSSQTMSALSSPASAPVQRKTQCVSEPPAEASEAAAPSAAAAARAAAHRLQSLFGRPDSAGVVQRKAGESAAVPSDAPSGSGSAMPDAVRTKMERAFGADFSAVRIHQGDRAAAIGALAYTQGTDIHFAPGRYDPSSTAGQELLGHELAHVVQQSSGRVGATLQKKGVAINDDSGLEREADQMGARAARGEPVHGEAGHAPASPIAAMSSALVQCNKTTDERNIPVQTTGNCGLFSILTALRAFGFSGDVQSKAMAAMDRFTKNSKDTFLGEIFTVDLMLQIINTLEVDGKRILEGRAVQFTNQEQLEGLLGEFKKIDNVALLIGYSKPDEYDKYYRMRGQHLQDKRKVSGSELDKALDDKVNVEDFKIKDAHWGMINTIGDDGFVDIADSIAPHEPGANHGYNTLMSTRKLFNSNESLSKGKFDWTPHIKSDQLTYPGMDKMKTTKDLSKDQRLGQIVKDGMKEKLDLSGKLVVVTVTEVGKSMLAGK